MTHKEIAEKYSKNEREHVAKKSKEYVLRVVARFLLFQ